MISSPLLDINNFDDIEFGPEGDFVTGYLDDVLSVFERNQHPFVLVGVMAMQWSGSNPMPNKEIDVLMQTSKMHTIVQELVVSGEWILSANPYTGQKYGDGTHDNTTALDDIWLRTCRDNLSGFIGCEYLRFWPEDLYKLSVTTCRKIEVPDIIPRMSVILEEEYYRDPHGRFGPKRLSVLEAQGEKVLPSVKLRCKLTRRDIPIFIPSVEDHLNALLDQQREELETNTQCGNLPEWHIRNFIRYHVWDWPPASRWLLSNKIHDRNYGYMKFMLERHVRKRLVLYDRVLGKVRSGIYPWELTPGPPSESNRNEAT